MSLFVVAVHVFLFQARDKEIETQADNRSEAPSGHPCPTDAGKAEEGRQYKDEHNAEDKIGEGTDRESDISVAAADDGIRIDLDKAV